MPREVTLRYEDPLDAVWRGAAARMGLRVVRSSDAYASTDGRGELLIGAPATLDADDCLAQMVFHEICHWLVEGPEARQRVDWGLDNLGTRDEVREHACLRLQAALSARHGLRRTLAPTTDHRAFYDALPADPLAAQGPSVALARAALARAAGPPWAPHLERALDATRRIVVLAAELGPREPDALLRTVSPRGRDSGPPGD